MSNEKAVPESTAVSTEATNPHVEAAQACLQELRLMRDQIPRFLIPESSKETWRLTSAASVPPEFVELTAVAVANQKTLARDEGATPAEIRDLLRYAEAYSPLADELEAMAQFVRFSVSAARNAAGSEALTTYALAQRLANGARTPASRRTSRTCAAPSGARAGSRPRRWRRGRPRRRPGPRRKRPGRPARSTRS